MTAQQIAFQVGRTYQGRSVCDADCVIRLTVAKRTAKTIRTTEGKTLRVLERDDGNGQRVEFVRPWGSYSMAPVVNAI